MRFYQNPLGRLDKQKELQIEDLKKSRVFHEFTFKDSLEGTGINYSTSITDDGVKYAKSVHYDHGTGIAVADVDNDGLIDVYFVNQLGCNALYKNLGGKFKDISTEAGVKLCDKIHVSASFADIDNDGWVDLYVTTVRGGNILYKNLGNGIFKDITTGSGVGYNGHSSSSLFFDYDNDGKLDLLLINVGKYTTNERGNGGYYIGYKDAFMGHLYPARHENIKLFKNVGNGKFHDVTQETKLSDIDSWSGDASFTDLNGDGFADFYLLNMQGNNHYYENINGEYFEDKTEDYFSKSPWGAMGIKFFDYNNDGRQDLYLTDMHSDMFSTPPPDQENKKSIISDEKKHRVGMIHEHSGDFLNTKNIYGNAFYENLGNGKFKEISDNLGVENFWPWGISTSDINADGYEDIFVTAGMGSHSFRYGINKLYLNDEGKNFVSSEFGLGIEPRANREYEKEWFTLDCTNQDKNHVLCQGKKGKYKVFGTLSSRSSVVIDIENDGDLDILTNEWNYKPQILVSNLSKKRDLNFIKVRLIGKTSNRDGIGAKIVVFMKDKMLTKYNDGKSGYLSQSQIPLYFGLDKETNIAKIQITWPSGNIQVIEDIKTNNLITIKEGG